MDRNQLIAGVTFVRDVMAYHTARCEAGYAETPEDTAAWAEGSRYIAETTAEIERNDTRTAELARAQSWVEAHPQSVQSGTFEVPNVNRSSSEPVSKRYSLDELLHAAPETVPAGSLDKAGNFRPAGGARNSVEDTLIRRDGAEVPAPRLDSIPADEQAAVRGFQKTVADMCLFGLMIDRSARSSSEGFETARRHPLMRDRWDHALRAMDVDTSGEGGTWVPTGIGSSVHEKVRALGKVAPLFTRINLPTNPWKWPIEGADAVAYRVAEPTGDTESKMTASTPGTVAATFDAEIFGARSLVSRSLDADSAVAILPYQTRKLVLAFVIAEEQAIINGDTDGTHMDSDVQALGATDARTAWDGLRKKGIAQTIATATTATALNLGIVRKAMGKWGANPSDLAFIIGVSNMHSLLADTNLLTVDKMGPQATILNGMIGSVFGVPVIVSEYVREDVNATGVYDAITTTKTTMLCVNRNEWAMGQRAALDVEADDSIYRETYQRVLVAFQREDFQHIGDAATNEDTAIAYNVTP